MPKRCGSWKAAPGNAQQVPRRPLAAPARGRRSCVHQQSCGIFGQPASCGPSGWGRGAPGGKASSWPCWGCVLTSNTRSLATPAPPRRRADYKICECVGRSQSGFKYHGYPYYTTFALADIRTVTTLRMSAFAWAYASRPSCVFSMSLNNSTHDSPPCFVRASQH